MGIRVQILFCTIHILRNVKRIFCSFGTEVEDAVWKLQSTKPNINYIEAPKAVREKFGDDVATYIIGIDPNLLEIVC